MGPKASALRLTIRGLLLNVLNPKLTIFFLAFLPQFVNANAPSYLSQLLLLSGVFMAMTFLVFVVYGVMAHAFRTAVMGISLYTSPSTGMGYAAYLMA